MFRNRATLTNHILHYVFQRVDIRVIHSSALSASLKGEIISFCNRAYEEDIQLIIETFTGATHILGYLDDILVCHALWVTRYLLQVGVHPQMRTAYVETVATDAQYRCWGFAAALMRCVIIEVQDYDLAALSPFSRDYYQRLGWELWRGPLSIRMGSTLSPSPQTKKS